MRGKELPTHSPQASVVLGLSSHRLPTPLSPSTFFPCSLSLCLREIQESWFVASIDDQEGWPLGPQSGPPHAHLNPSNRNSKPDTPVATNPAPKPHTGCLG